MHYPGSPTTRAVATHAAYVEVTFTAAGRPGAVGTVSSAAHSAGPGATAPSPFTVGSGVTTAGGDSQLSAGQWNSLLARIGGLEQPKVPTKPSSAAIRDPKSTGR
jgi:hypothetical protein